MNVERLIVFFSLLAFMVFLVLMSFDFGEHQDDVLTAIKIWVTAIITYYFTEMNAERKAKRQEESGNEEG